MAHTQATMERTRAIEAALDVVALHQEHSLADQLEIADLRELVRIDQMRRALDQRQDAVIKRLWDRNMTEDRRHEDGGSRAKTVCQILDKGETPQAATRSASMERLGA